VVGSAEAFYTCSDVDFGGGTTTPPATPPPTTTPPPSTPPPSTPPSSGTWAAGTAYSVGDTVSYNGTSYVCLQSHTALAGWEPPITAALWRTA
jgi:chitin-binding protein